MPAPHRLKPPPGFELVPKVIPPGTVVSESVAYWILIDAAHYRFGSMRNLARKAGVSVEYVSMVFQKEKPMRAKIMKAVGLEPGPVEGSWRAVQNVAYRVPVPLRGPGR